MTETQNVFIPLAEGDAKAFINPTYKETYDSLPRIYGNKKKYKSKLISIIRPKPKKAKETTNRQKVWRGSTVYLSNTAV